MYARMVADMRALTKRERQLLNSLEGIERFVESCDPSKDGRKAGVRLQVLEAVYKEYFEVRSKIELLLDEIDPSEDSETKTGEDQVEKRKKMLSDFEDRYCDAKAELLDMLEPRSTTQHSTESS